MTSVGTWLNSYYSVDYGYPFVFCWTLKWSTTTGLLVDNLDFLMEEMASCYSGCCCDDKSHMDQCRDFVMVAMVVVAKDLERDQSYCWKNCCCVCEKDRHERETLGEGVGTRYQTVRKLS